MELYTDAKYFDIKDGHCLKCSAQSRRCCRKSELDMCSVVFNRHRHWCSINMYVIFVMLFFLLENSSGFNLDVSTPTEFKGPAGSYFGYSAAMLNKPPSSRWLLFGAPRDNSTFMPNTTRSGAVYKCLLNAPCEELYVDDDTNGFEEDSATYNEISRVFINGRDNQWLGVALDVHPDFGVVTCASRWFNRYFEREGYFFMNGLCYQIPLDFTRNNIAKIPALIDASKQTVQLPGNVTKVNNGMGNLGGSVHYTKEGQDLLLGAPGMRTWTGGFIDLRRNRGHMTEYIKEATETSELAGYAMTSGNYFGNGNTYFAIGAPREDLTGKVFVYRGDQDAFVYENTDAVLDGSESTTVGFMPVNAYFGGALASEDVNNDGIDDLLVGAPFYSKGSIGDHLAMEEGLVMVYLGQSNFNFKVQSQPLTGSQSPAARFGSAISSLGDINSDKYNDIIIGAPYEGDSEGAVYIYNGCKTGVWPHYSQRITGSDMSNGLKSFGISLSKPVDMNGDDVNDIAIGAYLSDKAYLLFGQPVINIDISIDPSVNLIDKDTSTTCRTKDGSSVPCFVVRVCFRYTNRAYSVIDIAYNIMLDPNMEEFSRLVFLETGDNSNTGTFRIFSGETTCSDPLSVVIKSTVDLVTPVLIKANYSVANIPTSSLVKPTLNKFSGDSPYKNLQGTSLMMDFKKDCPDNNCETNLQVTAELAYDGQDIHSYFVIGTPMLVLQVTIKKSGDPSYGSNMFITLPKSLQYQKTSQIFGETEVKCGFVEEITGINRDDEDSEDSQQFLNSLYIPEKSEDELMLICSFGNPLKNNSGVSFHVNFVVPESITDSKLKFRLNATTLSTETAPYDNQKDLTLTVKNQVKTSFYGVSRPSYITVDTASDDYEIGHIYELRNQGPSPLPAARLTLQYPQVQSGGTAQLYLNKTTWSCQHPCDITCTLPDHDGSPTVYADEVGPTYFVNESPSQDKVAESRQLTDIQNTDCSQTTCARYECELKNIPPRESAVVSLEFVVNGAVLSVTSRDKVLTIRSDAFVRFGEQNRVESPEMEHFTDVLTDIYPRSPPAKTVPWWVILVSVIGGIVLIIVIVIILWKLGFFKRKKLEQEKLMQHQGEVQKMIPEESNGTEKA